MRKRNIAIALCAVLVVTTAGAFGADADPRETPTVLAVKRAKSSVVNIHSEKTAYSGDPVFTTRSGRKVNGMGTGIVLDKRGYIVTNQHVVNGVDSLRVTLEDGSTYNAVVITHDADRDLALIKIEATKPLTVMPLGTSSDLMLGETVIAVGNAFGYEHTVTKGIISHLSRDVEVNEKQSYKNLIQTDASINPGNSGGPLLNLKGEVVGINVAIRAGAQRIGFAIPIDDARLVIAQLMRIENFDGTRHGLVTKDVKSGETRQLVVKASEPDSPASKAGFQQGDVIVRVESQEVVDGVDLERALLGHVPGDSVEVVVQRQEKTETLALTLSEASQKLANRIDAEQTGNVIVRANNDPLAERIWSVLGLRLAVVPQNDVKLVNSRYNGGLQIVAVRTGSPAATSGIRQSDILVGLDRWETITPENISWVLDHFHQYATPNRLKFHVVREEETLSGRELVTRYGFLRVSSVQR